MTRSSCVWRLFSLDTLDTRFTASANAPKQQSLEPLSLDPARPSSNSNQGKRIKTPSQGEARPRSRWRSLEFLIYGAVFLVAIPLMFKSVYDVSNPEHPNYVKFENLLSPGWIPGRRVDNSDQQYAGFRNNLPYLLLLLVLHPLLRRAFERAYPSHRSADGMSVNTRVNGKASGKQNPEVDGRSDRRILFDVYFAILYLVALHGSSAIKVLLILSANFTLATCLSKKYVLFATWTFNIGILFANELFKGYPYSRFIRFHQPLSIWAGEEESQAANSDLGSLLDSYGGLIPRWEILFNITILRLISFNLDYCWSLDRSDSSALEKKQLDPSTLSERDRVDISAKAEDYSFRNYLAYTLYAPLYLTGPILTFNDYISQTRYSPKSIALSRTTLYGIRFIISLLTMEIMLHFIYAVAISKAQPAWELYSPFQLSMIGYFNLHIIWLKLLLPWRFFRFWALVDGIDPPENMVRCMSDNYSALAFWRGWHRSFNRWIVRYIYVPLGGSGGRATQGSWGTARSILNMLAVFTFVALWHDIQLRLLIWGWLVTLFVLPEVLAGFLFPKKQWQDRKEAYRVICGIGAVGNVLMMMAANLVGFAVGLDGLKGLVQGIVGSYSGLVYLVFACGTLFVGVQVMFELREQELRQGIKMKC